MSIDARIVAVTVIDTDNCDTCNGTGKDTNNWDDCPSCHGAVAQGKQVRLKLSPRESGGVAGQSVLTIVDPPDADYSGLIGTEIWGSSSTIMIGLRAWADRIGYTRIKLIQKGGE